jgi:hypothetical protein
VSFDDPRRSRRVQATFRYEVGHRVVIPAGMLSTVLEDAFGTVVTVLGACSIAVRRDRGPVHLLRSSQVRPAPSAELLENREPSVIDVPPEGTVRQCPSCGVAQVFRSGLGWRHRPAHDGERDRVEACLSPSTDEVPFGWISPTQAAMARSLRAIADRRVHGQWPDLDAGDRMAHLRKLHADGALTDAELALLGTMYLEESRPPPPPEEPFDLNHMLDGPFPWSRPHFTEANASAGTLPVLVSYPVELRPIRGSLLTGQILCDQDGHWLSDGTLCLNGPTLLNGLPHGRYRLSELPSGTTLETERAPSAIQLHAAELAGVAWHPSRYRQFLDAVVSVNTLP